MYIYFFTKTASLYPPLHIIWWKSHGKLNRKKNTHKGLLFVFEKKPRDCKVQVFFFLFAYATNVNTVKMSMNTALKKVKIEHLRSDKCQTVFTLSQT